MEQGLDLKGTKIPMNLHTHPTLPPHNKGGKSLWSRKNTPHEKGWGKSWHRPNERADQQRKTYLRSRSARLNYDSGCGRSCQRNTQQVCIKISKHTDKRIQIFLLGHFLFSCPRVTQFLPRSAKQKAAYPFPRQTRAGLYWKDLCSLWAYPVPCRCKRVKQICFTLHGTRCEEMWTA